METKEALEFMEAKESRASDTLPGWAAKLIIGALACLSMGISSWALSTTNALQLESVSMKSELHALKDMVDLKTSATKENESDIKRDIHDLKEKVDRIADAVGVSKAKP